jgi:hypothetical protein
MRIDRHAAAIVVDGQKSVRLKLDLDPVGVAGERLVHGVVDDFGEQVMQRLLVGAADIHAGTAANRLEAFEHLDVACGVAGLGRRAARRRGSTPPGAAAALILCQAGKQIAGLGRGLGEFGRLGGFGRFCSFSHGLSRTSCPRVSSIWRAVYGVQGLPNHFRLDI